MRILPLLILLVAAVALANEPTPAPSPTPEPVFLSKSPTKSTARTLGDYAKTVEVEQGVTISDQDMVDPDWGRLEEDRVVPFCKWMMEQPELVAEMHRKFSDWSFRGCIQLNTQGVKNLKIFASKPPPGVTEEEYQAISRKCLGRGAQKDNFYRRFSCEAEELMKSR